MAEDRITIEIEGLDEDSGEVRLSDFIAELTAFRLSLQRVQEEITNDRNPVTYRVADLSHASPYRVTIAITPRDVAHVATPRRISRALTSSLRMVRSNHRFARRLDPELLDSFKGLSAPLAKRVKSVKVYRETGPAVHIDHGFSRHLHLLAMTEQSERDQLIGRLDQLNIHNGNQFHIYPAVGPKRILCKAPLRMRPETIANAGKRVAVEGLAHYRKDAPFPHEMTVFGMEALPLDEELPRMSDLFGLAPEATGGKSAEDFILEFRNANW